MVNLKKNLANKFVYGFLFPIQRCYLHTNLTNNSCAITFISSIDLMATATPSKQYHGSLIGTYILLAPTTEKSLIFCFISLHDPFCYLEYNLESFSRNEKVHFIRYLFIMFVIGSVSSFYPVKV